MQMNAIQNEVEKKANLNSARSDYVRECCGLPIVRNKIVFMIGKYGGHAKYITEALIKINCGLEIVWFVDAPGTSQPGGVRFVQISNWKEYVYEIETARVWVFDILVPWFIEKREGQIYIQTKHWSSVTLKKFFLDDRSTTNTAYQIGQVKRNSQMMDYIFVGSEFDRNTCRSGFDFHGEFVSVGSPRSDAVFREENRMKIYARYHMDLAVHTVLYAPTFRYNVQDRKKSIILGLLFAELHEKLVQIFGGEWYVLYRRHPSLTNSEDYDSVDGNVIDVSGYDDCQELVAACDMLISDYSSIMFEPAFVKKPVLLFAPDKEQYIGKERELLIPYESLPFPIAETNEELWDIMEHFDYEEYSRNVNHFMQKYDVHEDGRASERAADFIMKSVMCQYKISVIIPVYNTAAYLPRCIESVINQTYRNIEVILVDDGSTDDSMQICERYGEKDARIRIVGQKNKGNNAARKAGLKVSTGDYIMFVDSDDWIGRNLITLLCEQVEKYGVDLVISNVLMISVDGIKKERKNMVVAGVYTNPKEVVKKLFFDFEDCKYGILPYIFSKLYRRDLLVCSMERIDDCIQYDEDRALVWTCLMQDLTTVFIDSMEYYYCQRVDGIVRALDELYLAKINYFYCYMRRLFENEDDILRKQLERYVVWNVQIALKWKMGMLENVIPKAREKYVLDSSVLMNETVNVVLYGAGAVGRDYYDQLQDSQRIQITAWVDKAWEERQREGLAVKPVEEVLYLHYEYILIAVQNMELFEEIKSELKLNGIDEKKILWGKPYGSKFLLH